ncbi:MAG TPA: dihydroorotate dehydrogenase [bacterium]
MRVSLSVNIGRFTLPNPVMVASGTFGYGTELTGFLNTKKIGAIVTKSISLHPKKGNSPPRIVETPSGMLNAIGLQNVGIENFIKDKLPLLKKSGANIIVSIFGDSPEEYGEAARRLEMAGGIIAIEVNISCPNRKKWNKIFAADPVLTSEVVKTVRDATSLPVIVKLSPNVTDIAEIALAAESSGADAISAVNTFIGMAVNIETRRAELGAVTGGLSGPAIKPLALRMVWEISKKVKIPVIGIGGIMNARDALEFLMVGAKAIQIGTATFVNPDSAMEIISGIEAFLKAKKIDSVEKIINTFNG